MKSSIRNGATALFFLCAQLAAGSTSTAARDRLYLSIAQERAILRSINDQSVKTEIAPSGFRARIGGVIPPSVALHDMPAGATRKVWAVRAYSYVLLKNRLLIVDPKRRKIVGIIWR
jgi:hypothetical protein